MSPCQAVYESVLFCFFRRKTCISLIRPKYPKIQKLHIWRKKKKKKKIGDGLLDTLPNAYLALSGTGGVPPGKSRPLTPSSIGLSSSGVASNLTGIDLTPALSSLDKEKVGTVRGKVGGEFEGCSDLACFSLQYHTKDVSARETPRGDKFLECWIRGRDPWCPTRGSATTHSRDKVDRPATRPVSHGS